MEILDQKQIKSKIKRLAYQIIEQYIDKNQLCLIGINNNGRFLQDQIHRAITKIDKDFKVELYQIQLSPAAPLDHPISINTELKHLVGKNVIIVDDVANTGRTMFYAASIFHNVLIKSLKICVLVDRMHKSFPISVDFVGLSLATTMKDDILVYFNSDSNWHAEIN